jgi:hypothetical protein
MNMFYFLDTHIEEELLGLLVTFENLPYCFPKQLYHFTFPTGHEVSIYPILANNDHLTF